MSASQSASEEVKTPGKTTPAAKLRRVPSTYCNMPVCLMCINSSHWAHQLEAQNPKSITKAAVTDWLIEKHGDINRGNYSEKHWIVNGSNGMFAFRNQSSLCFLKGGTREKLFICCPLPRLFLTSFYACWLLYGCYLKLFVRSFYEIHCFLLFRRFSWLYALMISRNIHSTQTIIHGKPCVSTPNRNCVTRKVCVSLILQV